METEIEKSVVEGNKAIAIFDGIKIEELPDGDMFVKYQNGGCFRCVKENLDEVLNLKYHSSWDELMPVWGKLGKVMYKIRQEISGKDYLQANVFTINILKAFQKADIKAAFNWISETIIWYNNQKQ